MQAFDFTLTKYEELLSSLLQDGYEFRTFESFCDGNTQGRFVILRHDVDTRPDHSLRCAELEYSLGIQGSYYFRIVPKSNHPEVIRQIASLGHEIGYHYEEMSLTKGDPQKAILLFDQNLAYFRKFYPVSTICMHGSPTSAYNNRDLWHSYSYHDRGITGEPYFDINFEDFLYLTDTGRCWDGDKVSVRDKVNGRQHTFHKTDDILLGLSRHTLPDHIMITVHPQRWSNNPKRWLQELIMQNSKNQIKKIIVKRKQRQKNG